MSLQTWLLPPARRPFALVRWHVSGAGAPSPTPHLANQLAVVCAVRFALAARVDFIAREILQEVTGAGWSSGACQGLRCIASASLAASPRKYHSQHVGRHRTCLNSTPMGPAAECSEIAWTYANAGSANLLV